MQNNLPKLAIWMFFPASFHQFKIPRSCHSIRCIKLSNPFSTERTKNKNISHQGLRNLFKIKYFTPSLLFPTDPMSLESVGGNRIQNWVSKWYCAPLLQAFQTNWTACLGYAAWLEHLTTWHLIARWTFKVHSTTNTLPKYQLIAKKDTWITDDEFQPII